MAGYEIDINELERDQPHWLTETAEQASARCKREAEDEAVGESGSVTLITDFVEFLATSPAPAAVVSWRPSEEAQGRLSDLLQRRNAGTLEQGEIVELENCIQAEQMLRLSKPGSNCHSPSGSHERLRFRGAASPPSRPRQGRCEYV